MRRIRLDKVVRPWHTHPIIIRHTTPDEGVGYEGPQAFGMDASVRESQHPSVCMIFRCLHTTKGLCGVF